MLYTHMPPTPLSGLRSSASLTGKVAQECLKRHAHDPDYDTGVDDLFEIIGHICKHEGVRLEVKAHSEETAVTQSA